MDRVKYIRGAWNPKKAVTSNMPRWGGLASAAYSHNNRLLFVNCGSGAEMSGNKTRNTALSTQASAMKWRGVSEIILFVRGQ